MSKLLVVPALMTMLLLAGCNDGGSGGITNNNPPNEAVNVSSQTRAMAASVAETAEPQEVDHLMADIADNQEPAEL